MSIRANNQILENFNIDDLVIIKRTPEYSKLIDDLIDQKSFIFSDKQLEVLKNPQQIFDISKENYNNTNTANTANTANTDIKNISNTVYINCKNELDKNTFDFDNQINNSNELIDLSDKEYVEIKKMLKDDINQLIEPNYSNTGVLKQNMPLIKNYLKNYYQDLYGNKIDADLKDYFIAYYTLINNNDNVGLPVNTLIGTSDFIIPDQYKYDGKFTNAYNIDWDRIINPISYSQ